MQRKAIDAGEFPAPTQWAVSGHLGRLSSHNEDYSKPFDVHPICWGCHSSLHVRFTKPERWEKRKEIDPNSTQLAGSHAEERWWEELH